MCHLTVEMLLALNCSLQWKQPDKASSLQHNPTEPICSHIGWLSVLPMAMDLSLMMCPQACASTSSLCSNTTTTMDSLTIVHNPSDLNKWRKPYAPWARSSPNWTSPIPEWMAPATSTASEPSSRLGTMKTQPPQESGLSTSPFSEPWHNNSEITLNQAEPRPSWTSASLASSSSVARVSTPSHPLPTMATANPSISVTPLLAMQMSSMLWLWSVP